MLAAAFGSLAGVLMVDTLALPEVVELEHYRPSTTTELFDIHGERIGSFALERRIALSYDGFSPTLREAVISIEDKDFESHWGVNVLRVAGAAWHDLRSSGRAQGASTLTMQLARNLFLSDERTLGRKLEEILLSIQIEHTFTKPQIFTLYGNQIYLGHGVYGFEAGAEFYFSKHARDLSLTEAATLAGLPKGPEEFSPTAHAARCLRRRNQVIAALLRDRKISSEDALAAEAEPLGLHLEPPPNTEAPWFVESVRLELQRALGTETVHGTGLRVYTTLDMDLQRAANRAVAAELAAYERRHGWRGPLVNLLAQHIDPGTFHHPDWTVPPAPQSWVHGVVMSVAPDRVVARVGLYSAELRPADWNWTGYTSAAGFLHTGDVVLLHLGDLTDGVFHATLEEDTGAQASLLTVDNASGDVLAMVGGRDFQLSQYNRATEARRQVGSSFKPYVYTAALEHGATPEQTIEDSPASFGGYTPHDYEGNTLGSMTLLRAFADSRNIPAVRLAAQVGMPEVIATARRFGITSPIPNFLPVALGAVDLTLSEQVTAYATFPDDGMPIRTRFIRRMTDADGIPLAVPGFQPATKPVISPRTARTMLGMMRAVTAQGGTAAEAATLQHPIAGKTGTTSGFTDAWFVGYSPSVTCGVWVGYDNRLSLGDGETGGKAALPIWMDVMRVADDRRPEERFAGMAAQ